MKSAIIRLAKKQIIRFDENDDELKRMWNAINENIEDLIRRRAGNKRLSWKNIHNRYRQELNKEASEYGMGVLQMLGSRLPDNDRLTTAERSIRIESSRAEIEDFTEAENSLVINYFLITEQLMLIDSIGELLLLAKKEYLETYQKDDIVQDTFTINLNDNYDIVEYSKLKSGN